MNDDDITIWDCPQKSCRGKLIKRINKKSGHYFLGCTNYPICKHTQKEDPKEDDRFPGGIPDAATVWERFI